MGKPHHSQCTIQGNHIIPSVQSRETTSFPVYNQGKPHRPRCTIRGNHTAASVQSAPPANANNSQCHRWGVREKQPPCRQQQKDPVKNFWKNQTLTYSCSHIPPQPLVIPAVFPWFCSPECLLLVHGKQLAAYVKTCPRVRQRSRGSGT